MNQMFYSKSAILFLSVVNLWMLPGQRGLHNGEGQEYEAHLNRHRHRHRLGIRDFVLVVSLSEQLHLQSSPTRGCL